jgi:SAM-dependent methyltransferase
MDDRTRWNERYLAGEGPTRVNARLQKYLNLLKHGRALDLAGGTGQNAYLLADWDVVLADISEQALARGHGQRVQADALALPFPPATFDTIVCTYFYDPRVNLAELLTPGGTLFFETYTLADIKYRPDFNPAHRFNPAAISSVFKGLEVMHWEETDDGARAFGTLLARKY